MGGFGSGRRAWCEAKRKTEAYRCIDVRRWQREGLLVAGRIFTTSWSHQGQIIASIRVRVLDGCLLLSYHYRASGSAWDDVEEPVPLIRTPCNYGGHRLWFRCPMKRCARRVALLYGAERYFACRHCSQLVYSCQRERDFERMARKADKLRALLHWEPGIFGLPGDKPKGMRWQTFQKLVAWHDALVEQSLDKMPGEFAFRALS